MDPILKLATACRTPWQMQRELFDFAYNKKPTMYAAATALKMRSAHCMEAALLAAAVLEVHGYPPIIMSFESKDRLDHVIYVYRSQKTEGLYGSIGRSRDQGLHGRPAIYKSLKDLAKSYLDPYVDLTGRLRAYEVFHLDEHNFDWRRSKRHAWPVEDFLLTAKHQPIDMPTTRYHRLLKAYKLRGAMPPEKSWWYP